jgi:hypothetical protein
MNGTEARTSLTLLAARSIRIDPSSTAARRRQALKTSLLLPLVTGVSAAISNADTTMSDQKTKVLVAYFTRTGNSRLIATQIANARDATPFRIVPARPYPADYKAQVAQAESERQRAMSHRLRLPCRISSLMTPSFSGSRFGE